MIAVLYRTDDVSRDLLLDDIFDSDAGRIPASVLVDLLQYELSLQLKLMLFGYCAGIIPWTLSGGMSNSTASL